MDVMKNTVWKYSKNGRMFKKVDSAQDVAMLAVSISGLIYSSHNDLSVIFNIICYQLILIGFGLIAGYLSSRSRR